MRSGERERQRDGLDPARSVYASHRTPTQAQQSSSNSNRHIRPAICLSGLVPKFLVAARGWWAWRRPATAVRGTYVCVRMCACRFGQSQSRWPHQVQGQGEQQSSRAARNSNSNFRPTRPWSHPAGHEIRRAVSRLETVRLDGDGLADGVDLMIHSERFIRSPSPSPSPPREQAGLCLCLIVMRKPPRTSQGWGPGSFDLILALLVFDVERGERLKSGRYGNRIRWLAIECVSLVS